MATGAGSTAPTGSVGRHGALLTAAAAEGHRKDADRGQGACHGGQIGAPSPEDKDEPHHRVRQQGDGRDEGESSDQQGVVSRACQRPLRACAEGSLAGWKPTAYMTASMEKAPRRMAGASLTGSTAWPSW